MKKNWCWFFTISPSDVTFITVSRSIFLRCYCTILLHQNRINRKSGHWYIYLAAQYHEGKILFPSYFSVIRFIRGCSWPSLSLENSGSSTDSVVVSMSIGYYAKLTALKSSLSGARKWKNTTASFPILLQHIATYSSS